MTDMSSFTQQPPTQATPDQPPPPDPQPKAEEDARSDTSFDPLFDDPEGDTGDDFMFPPQPVQDAPESTQLSMPGGSTAQPSLASSTTHIKQAVGTGAAAPAPKNAPPVLDPLSYTMFSPDMLLTASIDGQVVLWDRRVHTPGRGVGRLWMSEKTPPWCVSVSANPFYFYSRFI